jgi:hypothetical protein
MTFVLGPEQDCHDSCIERHHSTDLSETISYLTLLLVLSGISSSSLQTHPLIQLPKSAVLDFQRVW